MKKHRNNRPSRFQRTDPKLLRKAVKSALEQEEFAELRKLPWHEDEVGPFTFVGVLGVQIRLYFKDLILARWNNAPIFSDGIMLQGKPALIEFSNN